MSIPIVGQIYTTYHSAASLTRLGVEMVDKKHISPPLSVPLKVVTGGLLGTAGAVAGCTVSLIHMPAGPVLWLHQLKVRMDLEDYTHLADHFSRISFRLKSFASLGAFWNHPYSYMVLDSLLLLGLLAFACLGFSVCWDCFFQFYEIYGICFCFAA